MWEYSIHFFEVDKSMKDPPGFDTCKEFHLEYGAIYKSDENGENVWAKCVRVEIIGEFKEFFDADYRRINRRANERADQYNRRHGISKYGGDDVYPQELRDGKFAWSGYFRQKGRRKWEHGHY
jgi:hypothetical protein